MAEIKVGDRVYVPPRIYGSPYQLAEKDDNGTPGISGRVQSIVTGLKGQVAIIRDKNWAFHGAPLDLCRRQSGRSAGEKALDGARQRGRRLR